MSVNVGGASSCVNPSCLGCVCTASEAFVASVVAPDTIFSHNMAPNSSITLVSACWTNTSVLEELERHHT